MPIDPRPIQTVPIGPQKPTVPDTLISVVIAFALAFIGRAYVLEPFVIPTGSMAPTLLGAHYRPYSPESGAGWPVDRQVAEAGGGVLVRDPHTGQEFEPGRIVQRSGDRILVLKRTPFSAPMRRYEVAVFRNPQDPNENLIKRIIGMPGEAVALVDGDVFVKDDIDGFAPSMSAWHEPGWTIARKPEREQRAVWQTVFDAAHLPRGDAGPDAWPFQETDGWHVRGATLTRGEPGAGALHWDHEAWDIRDRLAYNDLDLYRDPRVGPGRAKGWLPPNYPVSDLAISTGFAPASESDELVIELRARGLRFEARVAGDQAVLRSAPISPDDADSDAWTTLQDATLPVPMKAGQARLVEFWHVDQSLWLFVGGRLVCRHNYDWSIPERLTHAIEGENIEDLLPLSRGMNLLASTEQYTRPEIRIAASGEGTKLHRLRVERDLYYHPYQTSDSMRAEMPPMGTHPISTAVMGKGQYFMLGDNSPRSADSRVWENPHPLVSQNFPATSARGVVPEELLIGRAFVVYFPSIDRDGRVPVPDMGRIRPIR